MRLTLVIEVVIRLFYFIFKNYHYTKAWQFNLHFVVAVVVYSIFIANKLCSACTSYVPCSILSKNINFKNLNKGDKKLIDFNELNLKIICGLFPY